MLKNWFVKTQQKDNFINHYNYLNDKNRSSHFYSTIHPIIDNAKNIVQAFDDRKSYRKENGLRGGAVTNEASSFIFSLPRDVGHPTAEQWEEMTKIILDQMHDDISRAIVRRNEKELADRDDPSKPNHKKNPIIPAISREDLEQHCVVVLHDESSSPNKKSHIHMLISNVMKNERIKPVSQYAATYGAKKGFNHAVERVLGISNLDYKPKQPKSKTVPYWAKRQEQTKDALIAEKKAVLRAEKAMKFVDDLKKEVKKTTIYLKKWGKDFINELFAPAEQKATKTAEIINKIDDKFPATASELDSIAKTIEKKKKHAPDSAKVTSKRKPRKRARTNK